MLTKFPRYKKQVMIDNIKTFHYGFQAILCQKSNIFKVFGKIASPKDQPNLHCKGFRQGTYAAILPAYLVIQVIKGPILYTLVFLFKCYPFKKLDISQTLHLNMITDTSLTPTPC